ncbi:hypothetical protein ACFV1W_28055 [Kitasatospora sp. NPDC059648]|uniref:hypothetical protein n=1 Tax=Kitasatospora sp. NPDC059648 TaxID=3346894 RepID=UPI00368897D6
MDDRQSDDGSGQQTPPNGPPPTIPPPPARPPAAPVRPSAWRRATGKQKTLLSVAAAGVALAVILTVISSSGSPDHSARGSGGPVADSPAVAAAHGTAAATALDGLPGIHLSAAYAPSGGKPVTQAELTVTDDGKASGTFEEPVTGKATMAWSGEQLYLKGDKEFWAQQGPQNGHDLTSSERWVAPEKRSGYYMLDSFGVNAGSLTPKSLAAIVRQVTSDPAAVQEDAGSPQGRRAISYTVDEQTVVLTADAPYTLVAIGFNPASARPVTTAAWHGKPGADAPAVSAGHRVVPADDGGRFFNPYFVAVPKPATDKETDATRAAAAEAAAAAVPPSSDARAARLQGPNFVTTFNSPYLCTSNPCSYAFTVTNEGDAAAEAVLHVSFPGIPDLAHPLGTLGPGQSKSVSGTRPNAAAGTGTTVRHTDYSWVYSSATYGPDPEVGQRLYARELKPDDVFVATPLKPLLANLLDQMTKDAPITDEEVNKKTIKVLRDANDEGQLPLLMTIAASGRLQNPGDLADSLSGLDKIGGVRVLQQIAHLVKTDPHAKVWYDGGYKASNGETYKTDYIYTSNRDGQELRRAVQVKTIEAWGKLWPRMGDGAEQLNGEHTKGSGKRKPENAPPGFERVLQINLEPSVGTVGYNADGVYLTNFLKSPRYAQARQNLCKPTGENRVDRLVIVNATGTHEWTDLTEIGVNCRTATG